MAVEVGRPTELNEELMLKIKDMVLEGRTIKEMSEILDIPYATMRYWSAMNYQSFADKLLSYKHERMLQKAEIKLEVHMGSEDEKVSLDAAKFVAETLGKSKGFSKRSELTGADGKDLPTPILSYVPTDNSDKENTIA